MSNPAGKIADSSRSEMPLTWKALAENTEDGSDLIQAKIDYVCVRLFGQVLNPTAQNALDAYVVVYAGKLVAIELINPGIDYWDKQVLSVGSRGQQENKSYADRTQGLRDLRKSLLEETRRMAPEVEEILPGRRGARASAIPRVASAGSVLVPDPLTFGRPFADPDRIV